MEAAEFQRILIRVIATGLLVIGLGTVGLLFAFRALEQNRERRGVIILFGAIAFILVVTFVLFRWSYFAG